MTRVNLAEQRGRKKDGRKTTNGALITLLSAGVIASIMMLMLGAGMVTALDDPGDGGESTAIDTNTNLDNVSVESMMLPSAENVSESRQIVVEMPKQDDPFKGSFVGPPTHYLNQVAQITFSVIPEADMPNSTIKFFMPPDVELVEGDLYWHGDLKKWQQMSFDLFVDVTEEVEQNIKAEAFTYIDGIKITRSYYITVSTMDESARSPTTGQKGTLIMQTIAKSSNMSSQPAPNLESTGYIEVMGRFDYVNENGELSPMRYIYTELWDYEIYGVDECIGYGYTDNDGNFYYHVDNNDGYLEGGRDVYVIVYAYSDAAKTTDHYDIPYTMSTLIRTDVPDGTVDFGSIYPPSYSEPWEAVDAAWSEYMWISSQVGWTRSQVHIKWPSGNWPCAYGDVICLPYKTTAEWGHATVYHEYAHCVMWTAYGDSWPPHDYSGHHHVDMESDEGFATLEGWAEFMPCAVDNDPNNLQGLGQNIETNDWHNKQDRGDFDGDIIEGSFASILWDIYDPANDDGLNMGFDEIWTILLNDRPDSIHDIWDGWFDRGYGHDQELWQIYYNHGVNKSGTIGDPPEIDLSPSSQSFGSVEVGECSSDYSFTLMNVGGGTAAGSVSLASSKFTITQGSGSFSLGAGDTKTIKVEFCPTSDGSKSATLFADGSNCNDDSSSLSGTGIEPLYPALCTNPDPPSHNFGDVLEGQTKSWAFDVTNCGTGTLGWTASDDQSWIKVTPASGSTTTEADEVTVDIDTTGLSVGTHTGQVTIDAGASGSKIGMITVTVVDVSDTAPPSAVADLTATNPTSTTLTLRWTAPGDDGSTGTAASYDVRYMTGLAITESNWNSANQCTGEPTPGPAGSSEIYMVNGLSPSTTYYFALKTADEVPNWSPISNRPQGTTKDGGGATTTVSFDPLKSTASIGSTTTVSLTLDSAPDGLSGYNLTVSLSDPSIAEILSVSFPAWANVHGTSTLPADSVWMKAADLQDDVKSDDTNIQLGTLTIRGDADGMCDIVVTVTKMDDDNGDPINPGTVSGTIEVTSVISLPGQSDPPTDPDSDGVYEDLNGNGNIDFDDVVQYFTHIDWIGANEPVPCFDFNGNGNIDFDDLVNLFGEV